MRKRLLGGLEYFRSDKENVAAPEIVVLHFLLPISRKVFLRRRRKERHFLRAQFLAQKIKTPRRIVSHLLRKRKGERRRQFENNEREIFRFLGNESFVFIFFLLSYFFYYLASRYTLSNVKNSPALMTFLAR